MDNEYRNQLLRELNIAIENYPKQNYFIALCDFCRFSEYWLPRLRDFIQTIMDGIPKKYKVIECDGRVEFMFQEKDQKSRIWVLNEIKEQLN